MGKINLLDPITINKIAAGEVVENPGSVVKELVENSIDAGTTHITVEILDGGRELIRVSDHGEGMEYEDALLALERHATSKIRTVEEIEHLGSMGFRGEAIPSIASVSKFSLITASTPFSPDLPNQGTSVYVEGGHVQSIGRVSCDKGTVVEVRELFFNVPVRRKFQKSAQTDIHHVLKIVSVLALAHPEVSFELISNHTVLLKTPRITTKESWNFLLQSRLSSCFPQEDSTRFLQVNFSAGSLRCTGWISPPDLHKNTRADQYLFVNRRPVTSSAIACAIREGYGHLLPPQRYPKVVLHLTLAGEDVDVNVHPQKKEVRFRKEWEVRQVMIDAVQNALHSDRPSFSAPCSTPELLALPPFWGSHALPPSSVAESTGPAPWEHVIVAMTSTPPPCAPALFTTTPRVIGMIPGYVMLDPNTVSAAVRESLQIDRGGFVLVDHAAAQRRLDYDHLLSFHAPQDASLLLFPLTHRVAAKDRDLIEQWLPLVTKLQFSVHFLGPETLAVDGYPSFLKSDEVLPSLEELLSAICERGSAEPFSLHLQQFYAQKLVCRRRDLSPLLHAEEGSHLVEKLFQSSSPLYCPNGKKIVKYCSPTTIAGWF